MSESSKPSEASSSSLASAAKSTLITGDFVGTVIEDQTLVATGDLDAATRSISNKGKVTEKTVEFQELEGAKGKYGTFGIEEDGSWSYKLKNTLDGVQSLGEGELVTEVFKVVTETGAISYVTINVIGTNDIPVMTGSTTGALTEDGALSIATGTITVTDVDRGQSLVRPLANQPGQYGEFSINANGNWTYTLNNSSANTQSLAAGEVATETFTVTSFDGSVSKNVTITVTGTNDAPVVTRAVQTGALVEDAQLTATGQVVANDVDHGAVLAFSGNASGVYGGFAVDAASGAWRYSLNNDAVQNLAAGETRIETFTVTVTDQFGAAVTQDVTVTITGTNDAPVISSADQAGAVAEDVLLTATGQVKSSDVDNNATATYTGNATGIYGSFAVDAASGAWTYTLDSAAHQNLAQGEVQTESFTVTVTDDQGAATSQLVTLTIMGTNDAPVITSTDQAGAVEENVSLSANGQVTASDVDQGATATFSGSAAGLYGDFVVNAATGSWEYVLSSASDQLHAGEQVTENFTVTVTDEFGASSTQKVSINVTGTNDVPQITSQVQAGAVADGGTLSAEGQVTVHDADNNATASYSGSKAGTYGSFVVDAATGTWTFVLDTNDPDVQALYQGQNVTEIFTVTVTDDQNATTTQDVTISILGKNNPPTITSTAPHADVWEDVTPMSANGQIIAKDVDTNSVLTFSVDTLVGTYGSFTLNAATGMWSYALDHAKSDALSSGETQNDVFTVTVTDEFGATASQSVTVTVHGTNDAPVIANTSITAGAVNEDGTLSATGQVKSTDVDHGATATYTGNKAGIFGSFVIDAVTGQWTYNLSNGAANVQALAQGASVTETFTVTVTDDQGATATQNVVVTINGTNDAPKVSGLTVSEGSISFTASDVDTGASLSLGGLGAAQALTNGVQKTLSVTATYLNTVLSVTDGIAPVSVIDVKTGTTGADILTAAASGSILFGYAGNDTLTGGVGVDYLFGGAGTDIFNVAGGTFVAGDVINGGAGLSDSIVLTSTAGVTADFTKGTVTQVEILTGSVGNDVVTITGNEGFTTISLGTGVDTLNITANANALTTFSNAALAGVETISLAAAGSGQTLNLSSQSDGFTIIDSQYNDVIVGSSIADVITTSGGGTNSLTGGSGADTYNLGAGIDTIIVNSAQSRGTVAGTGNAGSLSGYDIVNGFDVANDILDLQGTPTVVANTAGVNGNDSTLTIAGIKVMSHAISNGVISFDNTNAYAAPSLTLSSLSDVAAVVQYLHSNTISATSGSTVAFNATIGGVAHTYVYEQLSSSPDSPTDILIDLVGVTTTDLNALHIV